MATYEFDNSVPKSLLVKNFKCFGEKLSGFNQIAPINIMIGRNNSGKSSLNDLISLCISRGQNYNPYIHNHANRAFEVFYSFMPMPKDLKRGFREGTSGGEINMDHFQFAMRFLNQELNFKITPVWMLDYNGPLNFPNFIQNYSQGVKNKLIACSRSPFSGMRLISISAERNIEPEKANPQTNHIDSNGVGVTNQIRRFLMDDNLPRSEVEVDLLDDLNQVFQGDANFSQILCQQNVESDKWEIFLTEKSKGDIRLSQSGSALKSIIFILCTLRLVTIVSELDWRQTILAIEEPENNLHPALLRRLLDFLAEKRSRDGFIVTITTHSPICIDWSSKRDDSQIIHVQHDGTSSYTTDAKVYHEHRKILDDLDIRASDILQANGIIWVEGPSDRIYLNSWINLFSEGRLREGSHYTIMFYGGKLLFHLSALDHNESDHLISLISINRNLAIIMDSDRRASSAVRARKPRMQLGETKKRILDEVKKVKGFSWVTEGREIENYIPRPVLEKILNKELPDEIDMYAKLFEHEYFSKNYDKISLAQQAVEKFTIENLSAMLDLADQMQSLVKSVESWNQINQILE